MSHWVHTAMPLVYALIGPSLGVGLGTETGPGGWEWTGVPRVVAIGDVHGGYDKLIRLLKGAELVDDQLRWTGGSSHLVVAGDILDRGEGDRAVMDVLRRLQEESVVGGGRVHVLLGNHEVMNLLRNTKYVSRDSYRDFAHEERAADRVAALRRFGGGSLTARTVNLTGFNRRYPPGFFARQRSLDRDGEYGAWLLGLPAVIKINGIVYVHGGLHEDTAGLGIEQINRELTAALDRHLEARGVLQQAGVVTPNMELHQVRAAAEAALERRRRSHRGAVLEAASDLLSSADSPLLGERGPLRYRGNSFEDERIERESIERALEHLDARALVVAHTPTGGNRITSRFHGQLYRLDHKILESERPLMLVAEHEEMLVLDPETRMSSRPIRELPTGGVSWLPSKATLSDDDLQRFLTESAVVAKRRSGRGSTRPAVVALERQGQTRRGIFKTIEEGSDPDPGKELDRYQHEVAAYRLDRRIGLEMVPVTIVREIEGQRGSLQSWIEGAVDRADAESYGLDLYRRDHVVRQLARGMIFDALIGNHDRTPQDVLCRLDGHRVHLIDHSRAFSTSLELRRPEDQELPSVPRELAAAIGALDLQALEEDLGALLSRRQIEAVLERRDRILQRAQAAGGEAPQALARAHDGGPR